jgi:hypothetical protein
MAGRAALNDIDGVDDRCKFGSQASSGCGEWATTEYTKPAVFVLELSVPVLCQLHLLTMQ